MDSFQTISQRLMQFEKLVSGLKDLDLVHENVFKDFDLFFDDFKLNESLLNKDDLGRLKNIYIMIRDYGILDKYLKLVFTKGNDILGIEFQFREGLYPLVYEESSSSSSESLNTLVSLYDRIGRVIFLRKLVNEKVENTDLHDNNMYSDMSYLLHWMKTPVLLLIGKIKEKGLSKRKTTKRAGPKTTYLYKPVV